MASRGSCPWPSHAQRSGERYKVKRVITWTFSIIVCLSLACFSVLVQFDWKIFSRSIIDPSGKLIPDSLIRDKPQLAGLGPWASVVCCRRVRLNAPPRDWWSFRNWHFCPGDSWPPLSVRLSIWWQPRTLRRSRLRRTRRSPPTIWPLWPWASATRVWLWFARTLSGGRVRGTGLT